MITDVQPAIADVVYELKLTGEDEAIGVTYGHPTCSMDGGDWLKAGELAVGEHVATESGTTTVEYVVADPTPQRVYNLAVETDHRYLVGEIGAVVHNAEPCEFFADPKDALGSGGQDAVMVARSDVAVKNPGLIVQGFTLKRIYRMPWESSNMYSISRGRDGDYLAHQAMWSKTHANRQHCATNQQGRLL